MPATSKRLFVPLVCTCFLVSVLGACDDQPDAVQEAPEIAELVVLTPHGAEIRDAFSQRFSMWHEEKYGNAVSIRWIPRGTVDAQRYIYDRYEQYPDARSRQIGVDVFFGGGLPIHRDVAARGYAQPIEVPQAVLSGIPKELNGQPLYAPDGAWYGTALSGFGILCNKAAAQARGVPAPADWADLAGPAYRGWVAAADPALSGSTAECLILILLKDGWEKGWGVVTGILANCSGLLPSSGMIGPNVGAGVAIAGLQAEFVARMNVAAAPETLEFISPPSSATITPDPVTVLVGAQHLDSARHFVEFILSDQGQMLWALPSDQGGPGGEPLYRYPIRPDIYKQYADKMLVKGNPFTDPSNFKIDAEAEAAYTKLLPHLLKAACGSNHLLLQQAWSNAFTQGADSPALARLRAVPFDRAQAIAYAEECAKDPRRAAALQAEWSKMFRERYESVLGRTSPAATSTATAAR